MAKTIISTRNQQIRYLYHSLFSLQCCSTNPSFYLIHALSNTPTTTKSLPRSPLALRLDRMGNGFISYRFLCTSTPTNQSNSGSGGSTNSGNIESSGGGCHKTDQGKSIRGSGSYTSFVYKHITEFKSAIHINASNTRATRFKSAIHINAPNTRILQGQPDALSSRYARVWEGMDHKDLLPVSWMSFFLLFCTGAGLVYYYDREKKRRIEGRLLGRPQVCCTNFLKIRRSLDLERDMVEQVGEYVKEFHPNLIGLTGSPEEIKKTARAYRVYYMKTEEEGLDYLVDHSIVMYLMDPKMDFVKYFGKNNDVDMLADGIIMEIKQYKRVKA
ncbi:protein SCO1 1, mitochondrial isoform X1 [Capsicum annuum]